MNKIVKYFLVILIFSVLSGSVYSQELSLKGKFIKGNLIDKTNIVSNAKGASKEEISETALNFTFTNKEYLKDDEDFIALVKASVKALSISSINKEEINEILIGTFNYFENNDLRVAILEKIINSSTTASGKNEKILSFINAFLKLNVEKREQGTEVIKSALETLYRIGNKDSFRIVYNGWKLKIWKEYSKTVEDTLVQLAERNESEALKVFSISNSVEMYSFWQLLVNNQKISKEFLSQMSEKALSDTILSVEKSEEISGEQILLQKETLKVIADNNRTKSAALVLKAFETAKKEYNKNAISSADFVEIINCTKRITSPDTALTFSKYLEELNRTQETTGKFDKAVVLCIIKSLGELGDKAAFDNLLYVTYLSYPQEIVDEARNSLSKLKW